jgi:hypothetical protein
MKYAFPGVFIYRGESTVAESDEPPRQPVATKDYSALAFIFWSLAD